LSQFRHVTSTGKAGCGIIQYQILGVGKLVEWVKRLKYSQLNILGRLFYPTFFSLFQIIILKFTVLIVGGNACIADEHIGV
jgi:hypothetical protein